MFVFLFVYRIHHTWQAKLQDESRRTSLASGFNEEPDTNASANANANADPSAVAGEVELAAKNRRLSRELAVAKEQATDAMSKAKKLALGHFDMAIRAQTRTLEAQIEELQEESKEREEVGIIGWCGVVKPKSETRDAISVY